MKHEFSWMTAVGWYACNFILFVGLAVYFLKKPMKAMFENRSKALKEAIDEGRKKSAEAQERFKEYEEKLAQLDAEVAGLREEVALSATEEKTKIMAQTTKQIDRLRSETKNALQNEILRAERVLQETVAHAAVDQAAVLIQDNLSATDKTGFQDMLVDNLKKQTPKGVS